MPLEIFAIGGVYLPSFLVFLGIAAAIYLVLRVVLIRVHAYRLFWHPALAGAALFIAILGAVVLLAGA